MAVDFAFRTCGWLAGVFALNCSVFFLILDAEWFAVVYYSWSLACLWPSTRVFLFRRDGGMLYMVIFFLA